MHRVIRAFLVWVMVIATPVQGMAASAMLFCGPGHARMMQGRMADEPASAIGQATTPCHDLMAADHGVRERAVAERPMADGPVAEAEAHDLTGPFPHHGKFSCSACAACCSALGLPASFAIPAALSPKHLASMPPVIPVASHHPDGLDRPPRTVLA